MIFSFRRVLLLSIGLVLLGFILIALSHLLIYSNAKGKLYSDVESIKKNRVGLVLGTRKTLENGHINLYYKYRVEAAAKLFKAGKIDFILVSGDNSRKSYDEPTDFKEDLIQKGIPSDKIYLDYAGFRTLDSVVRAKEIFGQDALTFISQEFHNERAIFLAERNGIKAIGFNARAVAWRYSKKTMLREYLARVKVFMDLLVGVQPKYLGERIEIN